MFPDAELAYMWYAYFCSTIGQTLIQEISMLVQTDESFGYMLSSVRRRVLDVKDEAQLIASVQAADEAYIKAVTEGYTSWKSTVDEFGAQVMPPTTSIDIEGLQ